MVESLIEKFDSNHNVCNISRLRETIFDKHLAQLTEVVKRNIAKEVEFCAEIQKREEPPV